VATRFELPGKTSGSFIAFGTDTHDGNWFNFWSARSASDPSESEAQLTPTEIVALLREHAAPGRDLDASVEAIMTGYVPEVANAVQARFREGPEGGKEFEAWKKSQPETFQKEWDDNIDEHKDQFAESMHGASYEEGCGMEEAMYAEGENVPLKDLPKELQDNVTNPPPSVEKLKEKMEESMPSEESMMTKHDESFLPVERMMMSRQRITWTALPGTSKEAASGLYGYTKSTQTDVESSVRKAEKMVGQLARDIYAKDEGTVGFLQAHVKRGNSSSARLLLSAMKSIGPKVASRVATDHSAAKESGDKVAKGLYGHPAKTARLALNACTELRAAIGEIASDLHGRRQAKYAKITGFLQEHSKTTKCSYSRMLLSSYPDGPNGKSASADFNPEEISETKPGGALENDAEEAPYMNDNYTQQETNELLHKQESGALNDGKADPDQGAPKKAAPTSVQGWLEWQE